MRNTFRRSPEIQTHATHKQPIEALVMEQVNLKSTVNLRSTETSTLTQAAGVESTITRALNLQSTITPSLVLGSIIDVEEAGV